MNKQLHINDDLLVKYLLEEASQDEILAINTWLNTSAENQNYYNQLKQIWQQSLELAPTIVIDEKQAWHRFQERIATLPVGGKTKGFSRLYISRKQWIAAAALFILIASGMLFSLYNTKEPVIAMMNTKSDTHVLKDTLMDGSIVTLNKNTTLSYPQKFTGPTRKISIKGEAFFEVAPNKEMPFIIQANEVTITVVGTAFNVKNYDSSTEVIVESGIVKLSYNNNTIELTKGERILLHQQQTEIKKEKISNSLYNYYRTGIITCNATPLTELINTLNTAYNVDIILENNAMNQLQITSTFDHESIENILNIIGATFNITVSKTDSTYLLQTK